MSSEKRKKISISKNRSGIFYPAFSASRLIRAKPSITIRICHLIFKRIGENNIVSFGTYHHQRQQKKEHSIHLLEDCPAKTSFCLSSNICLTLYNKHGQVQLLLWMLTRLVSASLLATSRQHNYIYRNEMISIHRLLLLKWLCYGSLSRTVSCRLWNEFGSKETRSMTLLLGGALNEIRLILTSFRDHFMLGSNEFIK